MIYWIFLAIKLQEEAIKNRHQYNQMPQQKYIQHQQSQQQHQPSYQSYQQQQQQQQHMDNYQQNYPHNSNVTNDRVNQLNMYRNHLSEKQQQLYRSVRIYPK